jgi:hypothetical protein
MFYKGRPYETEDRVRGESVTVFLTLQSQLKARIICILGIETMS